MQWQRQWRGSGVAWQRQWRGMQWIPLGCSWFKKLKVHCLQCQMLVCMRQRFALDNRRHTQCGIQHSLIVVTVFHSLIAAQPTTYTRRAPRSSTTKSTARKSARKHHAEAAFCSVESVPETAEPVSKHQSKTSLQIPSALGRHAFFGSQLPLPALRIDKDKKVVKDRGVKITSTNENICGR